MGYQFVKDFSLSFGLTVELCINFRLGVLCLHIHCMIVSMLVVITALYISGTYRLQTSGVLAPAIRFLMSSFWLPVIKKSLCEKYGCLITGISSSLNQNELSLSNRNMKSNVAKSSCSLLLLTPPTWLPMSSTFNSLRNGCKPSILFLMQLFYFLRNFVNS